MKTNAIFIMLYLLPGVDSFADRNIRVTGSDFTMSKDGCENASVKIAKKNATQIAEEKCRSAINGVARRLSEFQIEESCDRYPWPDQYYFHFVTATATFECSDSDQIDGAEENIACQLNK